MIKKKSYNILFHLHTISGIIISAVLFILFFCGAFSMLREEIIIWESNQHQSIEATIIDYDKIYKEVDKQFNLVGRNISFLLSTSTNAVNVYIDHSHLPEATTEDLETHFLAFNLNDYSFKDNAKTYNYGDFIYKLHYLGQIPVVGIYLAGIVSLLFLFAIITGIYIHWDKLLKNIAFFRPYAKWKTIWTDAHTVLGTIGIPFQLLFAITGAYFCLSTLILVPAYTLYNYDADKLFNDLSPQRAHAKWDTIATNPNSYKSINDFVISNINRWNGFNPASINIENIGGTNMEYQMTGNLDKDFRLSSLGIYSADAYTFKTLQNLSPYETSYTTDVQEVLSKLHFGDYGGYVVKFIYIGLAFLTCFVIISGVMVWLVSHKNQKISSKKKNFNFQVANVYLAICLSLFPVIGLGFIAIKVLPKDFIDYKPIYINCVFFISWLLFSLYFIWKKNLRYTNDCSILLSGILFSVIPIFNGIFTNKWFWTTYNSNFKPMFIIDIFCLITGIIALYSFYLIRNKRLKEML